MVALMVDHHTFVSVSVSGLCSKLVWMVGFVVDYVSCEEKLSEADSDTGH